MTCVSRTRFSLIALVSVAWVTLFVHVATLGHPALTSLEHITGSVTQGWAAVSGVGRVETPGR